MKGVENNMSCGIYLIRNKINDKVYIGLSVNIEERWQHHRLLYLEENSKEKNKPLYLAFKKYGIENFDFQILEECSISELSEREKYYIRLYDCCILDGRDKGYNLTRGGEGYLTNDYYQIYELWKNGLNQKVICQLLKISEGTVIRALNSFGISTHVRRGRAVTEVMKARRKPVEQYDKDMNYIACYASIAEASRATNTDKGDIGKTCAGKRKSAGGYVWKWKEKEEI